VIISGIPFTLIAITGNPHASASLMTFGQPSLLLPKKKISAALYHHTNSLFGTKPIRNTLLLRLYFFI